MKTQTNQPRVLRDLAGLTAEELAELAGLVAAIEASPSLISNPSSLIPSRHV